MKRSAHDLQRRYGKIPRMADTIELIMPPSIEQILAQVGFDGAFVDGRLWVLGQENAAHIFTERGIIPLLARHFELSDDVAYRFLDYKWPMTVDHFVDRITNTSGDLVTLGWDFETFGEHHDANTGIFEFLEALSAALDRRGITCLSPSESIIRFQPNACDLQLSSFPSTWADQHGGLDFFLGNDSQQALFGLMMSA